MKKVNKCVLPTHEEGEHLQYSTICKCNPVVVEYSTVKLFVHRELAPRPDVATDNPTKRNYLRGI